MVRTAGMPRGRKDGGTGRNGKEKPVVVMGRGNGGSGQNAGDAQGEKTAAVREGMGRENQWWLWDGKMEEVVRTLGMPRGRRRRHGRNVKRVGKGRQRLGARKTQKG